MIIRPRTRVASQKGKRSMVLGDLCARIFSATARRYHIDFWKPDPSSVRNDLCSLCLRPQKPQENSARFCSPFSVPSSLSPSFSLSLCPFSCPKALPNTDQLSSNCVSRLGWSLGLSATVIPLQALGPRYLSCVHTRVQPRTYTCVQTRTTQLAIPKFLAEGMLRQDPLDRTHPIHPYAESNGPRPDFLSEAIQRSGLRARQKQKRTNKKEKERERAINSNMGWRTRFSDFHEEDKRENA